MKNAFRKLVLATIPFLVMGCDPTPSDNPEKNTNESGNNESGNNESGNNNGSGENGNGSNENGNGSGENGNENGNTHTHSWKETWESDANNHWHACESCNEKNGSAAHDYEEWTTTNLGQLLNNDRYQFNNIKTRKCKVCGYEEMDKNQKVLPEIRFTFNPDDENADFATKAKSDDKKRPSVSGKISVTGAGDLNITDADATMKVRGNQTAGFDKKGLQIKFDKKQKMLNLNGGKKFKKWVLLADAKDTTVSRTALGLSMSKGVIGADSKVWASDFAPVSVYLNDQYWGMYMLAEQKEVKDGRIKLDEPIEEVENAETGKTEEVPITTTDIGYCFEMDYYAKNEPAKGADGDPTFSIDYKNYFTRQSYSIESCLANSSLGIVSTYTMNSDIKDGPSNAAVNENNSNQVKFIKNRLQALFTVLAEASKNKVAKDINDNNEVVSTSLTVKETIEKNFDLNAWAEGFIINGVCLPPDVGYSSFYLSFDNTPNGDKKLRYDNPWDFDSNFGNRRGFLEKPDEKNGNNDPYFMDRTANMWLQLLGKFDFFMNDYVKPKWKTVRENRTFENMLNMLDVYYEFFEGEYERNFAKWPTTQASDSNVANYFNGDGVSRGELRKPFVNVNDRKQAQQETINWLTKRVNYLDTKWGK